jgi:hypothetical protein
MLELLYPWGLYAGIALGSAIVGYTGQRFRGLGLMIFALSCFILSFNSIDYIFKIKRDVMIDEYVSVFGAIFLFATMMTILAYAGHMAGRFIRAGIDRVGRAPGAGEPRQN